MRRGAQDGPGITSPTLVSPADTGSVQSWTGKMSPGPRALQCCQLPHLHNSHRSFPEVLGEQQEQAEPCGLFNVQAQSESG